MFKFLQEESPKVVNKREKSPISVDTHTHTHPHTHTHTRTHTHTHTELQRAETGSDAIFRFEIRTCSLRFRTELLSKVFFHQSQKIWMSFEISVLHFPTDRYSWLSTAMNLNPADGSSNSLVILDPYVFFIFQPTLLLGAPLCETNHAATVIKL